MPLRLTILFFFSLANLSGSSQTIDSIHTEKQAIAFVRNLGDQYKTLFVGPLHPEFWPEEYIARIVAFGPVSFQKADFDNNGLTDLLINRISDSVSGIRGPLIFLSFGKDSFQVKEWKRVHSMEFFSFKSLVAGEKTLVNALTIENELDSQDKPVLRSYSDTLIFAFGHFIERSPAEHHDVHKITWCAGGGMGDTGFRMTIVKDSVRIDKANLDSGMDETLLSKMDAYTSSELYGLLNELAFPHLKDHYHRIWDFDVGCGYLEISYDSGKTKGISDNGYFGTFGLRAIYQVLWQLKDTLSWKSAGLNNEGFYMCDFYCP